MPDKGVMPLITNEVLEKVIEKTYRQSRTLDVQKAQEEYIRAELEAQHDADLLVLEAEVKKWQVAVKILQSTIERLQAQQSAELIDWLDEQIETCSDLSMVSAYINVKNKIVEGK